MYYAYAELINKGFVPDTLLMNAAAWQIFASEGISRQFGMMGSMASLLWADPNSKGSGNIWKGIGGIARGMPSTTSNVATLNVQPASIFPTPLRIVISPHVPYDSATRLTDLVLMDSQESGFVATAEGVTNEEWRVPERDLVKGKLREYYSVGVLNEGASVGILRNVKVSRSWDLSDRVSLQLTTGDISQSLTGDFSRTAGPTNL